jgi:hypothetical protein
MEGAISFYEVNKLYTRVKELEAENAALKKKLETSTAERLGMRSVSFGSPCMDDPVPEPTCVPRGSGSAVWRPAPHPSWCRQTILE